MKIAVFPTSLSSHAALPQRPVPGARQAAAEARRVGACGGLPFLPLAARLLGRLAGACTGPGD